ncbi:MAG: Phosphoribosylformylglycinamidine synthase subunit PurL [Fimbriimonadaceae bacterium]|nr:Phosphoribosylformylglycinamidine synthase subunit PurL [Fimbriimonadaceae bacterium]
MGLTDSEHDLILQLLGRQPTLTELGMFAVMWSEHCGYKYSRPILAYFKKYREAMAGSGLENAGVVDIGDGIGVTMKVESHNHPSAVEPYQGAATGVGGIIRDIFTMGARPIASLNSLRFGPLRKGEAPDGIVERNRHLFEHVVAGIAGYGNCVGVPTVAGDLMFHPRYSGNPLVNAMSVGTVPMRSIATAAAQGAGNKVIYLGAATGKDGIHGATFASDALGEDSDAKRPNVQIGDPFAEKLLIEATLEALETGAVVAIQDMGAAGLTCSTTEMASKGGVGMRIDLDRVPTREEDISAYEMMLSESQERMLAVAAAGREQEVIDVFHKWGVHAEVIGEVTDDRRVRISRKGERIVDVPPDLLTDRCPTYSTPIEVPAEFEERQRWTPASLPPCNPAESLKKLLASPNLSSRRWVWQQYDQEVQTRTAVGPGASDGSVIALRETRKAIVVKIDGNARWTYADPQCGGMLAAVEATRNVACLGAKPVALTDGLNFGNPQYPSVFWQFERAVRGIADASEALGTPVISGNVSFYNESELGEVLPTPLIGALGVLVDAESAIMERIDAPATIVLLEYSRPAWSASQGIGASEYLAEVCGVEHGVPEGPDLARERDLNDVLVEIGELKLAKVAHDISEGGLAFALAELAIWHGGIQADCPVATGLDVSDLFGEWSGRVLVLIDVKQFDELANVAGVKGLSCRKIGTLDPESDAYSLSYQGKAVINEQRSHCREIYENVIPNLMSE